MRWVAIVTTLGGCTHICNLTFCLGQMTWIGTVPDGLDASTFEARICRNETCVEGPLAGIDEGPVVLEEGVEATLEARLEARLDRETIRIDWAEDTFADGDVWTIEIRDSSGAIAIELEPTPVDYTETYPNGTDCPGVCRSATLGE